MAFYRGYGGKVTRIGSPNVDLCVGKWSFTKKVELIIVITSCGRSNLGGIPSVEGTIDLPYDDTKALETIDMDVGDTVSARFYLGNSGDYYAGTVFIDQITVTNDNATGPVMISAHFVANLDVGDPGVTLTQA